MTFGGPDGDQACTAHKADWKNRLIPALKPDIIVVIGRTLDDPSNSVSLRTDDGIVHKPGAADYDEVLRTATTKTIDDLKADGRKVVIIEPIPYASDANDPLRCLSGAKFLEECRYLASPGPFPSERIYRSIAAKDPDVWTLDMDTLVDPDREVPR